ncbi:hypothetical protein GENT5_14330 [Flavobacterium ammoniigenes]|uniref:Uncharacterized protein n=1 Tax=Flavobacterium ammoniigenes TaxID=1751095 RepID=A0ABN6L0E4_9FLAO|nr:hypothetical protein [Flavobacterium ammoniigenes]BDB55128.1 hypothetical protein GENT5_14330 [Flavobacterium ammoniigenes]
MTPIPMNQFIEKITSICYFDISYDEINKTYLFNFEFTEDVDLSEFENAINKLKYELIDVLRSIKYPQIYIDDLRTVINEIKIWFETNGLDKFENFDNLNNIMTISKDKVARESNPPYTIDTIFQFPEDLRGISDPFLFYLLLHKSKTNNYENKNDLEKVKLYYVLTNYLESINSFSTFLEELTSLIDKYGINFNNWELIQPIIEVSQKCNFNNSKIRLAQLFKIFKSHKVFTFGNDPFKSTVNMKRFIESNFNYSTGDSIFHSTKNINQEFSILSNFQKDEQIKFCEEVIEIMRNEIAELKSSPNLRFEVKRKE